MKRSPLLRLLLSVPFVVVAVVVFIGGSECADTVAATTAVAVTAATNAPTDTVLMDGETVEGIPGYCAWEPDYSCYAVGLPACCFNGVDQVSEILGLCIRYVVLHHDVLIECSPKPTRLPPCDA
jgi:hypothetical protein